MSNSQYVKKKSKHPALCSSDKGQDVFRNPKVGHRIPVEIYRVSDSALAVIDRFECHPKFYARKSTKCELSSSEVLDCFVYFANGGRPSEEKSKLLKNY